MRRFVARGLITVPMLGVLLVVPAGPSGAVTGYGGFVPIEPTRVADTRSGSPISTNGGQLEVQVTGVVGVPVTASAVSVTITVTGSTTGGFVSAHPSPTTPPVASVVNFVAGQTVANSTMVMAGTDHKILLTAQGGSGTVHVLVDVTGYIEAGYPPAPGGFVSFMSPPRLLDTRVGTGAPQGAVPAGSMIELQVAGVGGVPADAAAVALNVTAVNPTGEGWVTVAPSPGPVPGVSNLNYPAGSVVPNQVIVKVGDNGKILIRADGSGSVHLLADLLGYFQGGGAVGGGGLTPMNPQRIADTRSSSPLSAGSEITVDAGPSLISQGRDPAKVGAIAVNLTAANPTNWGFLRAFASGTNAPDTSNLNYTAGETRAVSAIVRLGADGEIKIRADGGPQTVHVLVDIAGAFSGSPGTPPSGLVYAWGNNDNGQLCTGADIDGSSVQQLSLPAPVETITGVEGYPSTGGEDLQATLLQLSDGSVYGCGLGASVFSPDNPVYEPTEIAIDGNSEQLVSSPWDVTYLVTDDGAVQSWGDDTLPEIPLLGRSGPGATIAPVSGLTAPKQLVAAGDASYALTSNGALYSWGRGYWGELGQGATTTNATPAAVVDTNGQPLAGIDEIFTRDGIAFAETTTGQLYGWGYNAAGQIGVGTTTHVMSATLVNGLPAVEAVAFADRATFALTTTGEVYAWGANERGQLGLGDTAARTTPTKIAGLAGVTSIAAGGANAYAVTTSGALYAWGGNEHGQAGTGGTSDVIAPQQILAAANQVITNGATTFAILTGGALQGWGANASGQVGAGSFQDIATPQAIGDFTVQKLIQGIDITVVLSQSGDVYTMGANYYGDAANSSNDAQPTPWAVPGVTNIAQIAYNRGSVFAITQ